MYMHAHQRPADWTGYNLQTYGRDIFNRIAAHPRTAWECSMGHRWGIQWHDTVVQVLHQLVKLGYLKLNIDGVYTVNEGVAK